MLVLVAGAAHAAVAVFSTDVQMCSGRPWIDVTCNGADPTGVSDSTTAINSTFNTAITSGVPVLFPAGSYKVTSKITVDFQGQAANGLEVISRGASIDGRTIASGNVIQFLCSGGTTVTPVVCNNLRLTGQITVVGSTASYVVVLGKTDFSDQIAGALIEHLVVTNNSTGGAIQANYLTNGNLWLSGSTAGGSSSIGAVALEQVQTSRIGGWGSALGASAPGLLIENGSSVGNQFTGFAYDPNSATCISIVAVGARRNAWLAPYLPCATSVNATTGNNQNVLMGPSFVGTNAGPTSTGITIVGRGNLNRFSAPAVASQTLYGTDDGTIFSSANATGPSTQFAAASLPVTLPDPVQVGPGWTAAFVTDGGKAVVLSTSAGGIVLAGKSFSTLTVGAINSVNFESAVLQSDGANFRVTSISQGTALLNGGQTAAPARWEFVPGPGYQMTQGDNGGVISSLATGASLSVTLPTTTGLATGWNVNLVQDGGKRITAQVSGTNGGQIMRPGVSAGQSTLSTVADHQVVSLQFDGSNFREVGAPFSYGPGDVTLFGAKCDGTTDDTAAFQRALNGEVGGIVTVPPLRCVLNSGITLPAQTQLECTTPFPAGTTGTAALNTVPAIVLNPPATIGAAGNGVGVSGCFIVAKGLTFPITSAPTWTGIAVADNGYGDFALVNDTIVGFDTAFYNTGVRPYVHHVYLDGTGVTHAVLELDVGPTDIGYADDVKVQPIAGINSCAAGPRPGTGVRIGDAPFGTPGPPGVWLDNIISQNFAVRDFDFQSGVIAGDLWADNITYVCGTFAGAVGVFVAPGTNVKVSSLYVFSGSPGIYVSASLAQLYAQYILVQFNGGDCIQTDGVVEASAATLSNCTGAAVKLLSNNGHFHATTVQMFSDNGGVVPYFKAGATALIAPVPWGNVAFEALLTDGVGNLFDSNFVATVDSVALLELMKIAPTVTGTGAGSTGTYTPVPAASGVRSGRVAISAGGSGIGASGTLTLSFPINAANTVICTAGLTTVFGGFPWANGAFVVSGVQQSMAPQVTLNWSNNGVVLTPGGSYSISYMCDFR